MTPELRSWNEMDAEDLRHAVAKSDDLATQSGGVELAISPSQLAGEQSETSASATWNLGTAPAGCITGCLLKRVARELPLVRSRR